MQNDRNNYIIKQSEFREGELVVLNMIAVSVCIFGIIAYMIWKEIKNELQKFKVVHYQIKSSKLHGIKEQKIVFLSDLHNHVYGEKNEELLEAIRKEKPEYILVGGDMLVSNNRYSYLPALRFMKELTTVAPVYCANGNHEQRLKEFIEKFHMSYAAYRRILREEGVHFLENDSAIVKIDGIDVRVTGLEVPLLCYKRGKKIKFTMQEMETWIGERRSEYYEILMAHNPSYMDNYVDWGADLVLSGHLHGGIVRLPIFGGVIAPNFRIFPRYSGGHYQEKDTEVVVSKGLGTHTINIRLWNPAEMIVLHLEGK